MRRPRSKLEVSTFPFLAVLLCAMGALLLLLFIMDRRAKIAAQHTVSEAVAERKKRTEAEEQARQDEWLKAKDLLHQTLLDQHGQVLAEATGAQQNLDLIAGKVANAQSQHLDLKGKLDRESSQVAALQAQIASQRAGLKDTDLKDRKAKAELLEAAKELAELERAFQQLRALKDREKHVYSVVPYRGKRGEARAPIYVECVRGGVVFHPEKKTLNGWDFTPEMMKSEVERRTGTLGVEKTAKEKSRTIAEERKGPYVLFLIRPEGIASYYQAQAGLKGYDLDFGYELVDEDWVLDFNGDPNAKPAPTALAKNYDLKKSAGSPPLRGPVEKGRVAAMCPPGLCRRHCLAPWKRELAGATYPPACHCLAPWKSRSAVVMRHRLCSRHALVEAPRVRRKHQVIHRMAAQWASCRTKARRLCRSPSCRRRPFPAF